MKGRYVGWAWLLIYFIDFFDWIYSSCSNLLSYYSMRAFYLPGSVFVYPFLQISLILSFAPLTPNIQYTLFPTSAINIT